jgi:broad specificity phosphatase PhoE
MSARLTLVLTAVLLLVIDRSTSPAQELIYLVRHAEKADPNADDPPLSDAGRKRAARLAEMLKDAGVTDIFVSSAIRTQETAKPLAEAKHITPIGPPPGGFANWADTLHTKFAGRRVLVVGHTDTVPELIQALGHPNLIDLDDEFDNLFVLVPRPSGPPTLVRLRY